MNLFFEQIGVHARIQFLRHLRSPAIWWLAIAAPIGARFLVPDETASYSVMAINDATLALDSGVIGLQLGVIMAIVLSPLAYIFLRAGPTRRTPWQAENVTPARRSALALGHWLADTAALWILMLALAGAGVMLAYFKLPASEVNPFQICLALCLIAAPVLAVIAALRTIFSMRPMLRKAGGDVLFIFVWLALIMLSTAYFALGVQNGSPFYDVFGFAAPLGGSTDYNITELLIFGPQVEGNELEIDAMAGVLDSGFLLSRLIWVSVSGGLVVLSGLIFKPTRARGGQTQMASSQEPPIFTGQKIQFVKPIAAATWSQLQSEWHQIFRPIWFAMLLLISALAGAFLPFRGMVGPALAILLIFPLSLHGARWRGREMSRLTDIAPISAAEQFSKRILTSILLALVLCLPAFGRMIAQNDLSQVVDILAIGVGLPILAIGLGHATRGPVAGRLILLILWYLYLNL